MTFGESKSWILGIAGTVSVFVHVYSEAQILCFKHLNLRCSNTLIFSVRNVYLTVLYETRSLF